MARWNGLFVKFTGGDLKKLKEYIKMSTKADLFKCCDVTIEDITLITNKETIEIRGSTVDDNIDKVIIDIAKKYKSDVHLIQIDSETEMYFEIATDNGFVDLKISTEFYTPLFFDRLLYNEFDIYSFVEWMADDLYCFIRRPQIVATMREIGYWDTFLKFSGLNEDDVQPYLDVFDVVYTLEADEIVKSIYRRRLNQQEHKKRLDNTINKIADTVLINNNVLERDLLIDSLTYYFLKKYSKIKGACRA